MFFSDRAVIWLFDYLSIRCDVHGKIVNVPAVLAARAIYQNADKWPMDIQNELKDFAQYYVYPDGIEK